MPASTRARVKEDAAAAKARLKESGRKGGEASTPDAPRQDGKPGQFESEALRDWATENRRPSEPSEKTENAVKVWLRDTSHMFTRVYRELGPAEHPHLQTLLRRLTRHGDAIGYARAQMDIARVVAGLSDDERAFFNDLILIRDLHEDIQARREALATEEAEKLDARKNTITARYNEQRDRLMERIAGEGTALEKRREGMERQRRQLERGLAQRETDLALAGLQEGVAARGGTTDVDRLGREMAAARATIRGLEARGAERAADFDRRVAVLRAQVDAATEAINGMLESLGEAQHSGNLDRVKRLRAQMPAANARLAETEARIGVEETRKANHAAAIDRRIRIQRERLETLDGQRQMARESARAESAAKNAKMRAEERRRAVEREIGKLDTRMRVLDKRLENLKERAPERMAEADARHAARLAKEDATLPGRIAAAEAALPTPRGVSIPQIAREHRLLNEEMKQAPKVAEALRKHKALMRRVTERYLAAAEGALGKAPEFWREEHYRRLMVDEARKMVEERTRGLRAPTKRGMLKERTGKLTEYKTDYVTVQFNHLSRLVRDTLHYELLAEVRKLDITRQVYREAMRANDAGALAKLAELQAEVKKQVGAGDFKPSEKFQPLVKLAEAGLLPDDGQWGDVVDAWASSGAAMPLAVWERTGEYLKWLLEGETAAGDVVLQSVRASAQSRKKALGEAYLSPDDLVPEGYKPWRMSDSPLFEPVWREPEALADAAIDALAKEAGLPQMERRSPTLLLPENVADLMNRMGKPRADDTIGKALELTQKPRRFWTWATMFGPTRFIGGAVRDLAGNVDATIALNPHALTKLRQAGEEVHALLVKKEAPEPGSPLYEAVEKGLFTSLFANIEDGGVLKGLDLLGEAARRDQGSAGAKAVLTYMKMSQIPREIPEAVMRYAQILSFDEQVKGSPEGLPATFGASRPEVIQQLPEKERAHRLAMDVMVNYDQQNEAVEFVRAVGNPFARFAVGNMARYWRAYSNALADPRLMRRLGLRFGGRALSVGAAVYLGNLAVKTIAFGAMLEAWNRWRFGDEEDRLPPHVRSKPHLILGNHPVTGELMVLTNLSVLPSAIAWFGAEDSRGHVDDILNGRKTLRQIGQEMAKDAGRTAAGLVLGPELQAGIEGMTGRRLFPDPFDPRPIRGGAQGRVLHVLDAMIPFPFKDVRIAVAGTPDERARQAHALASLGAQPFDLGKAQYDEVRGRVFDWKAEKGKGAPSGAGSARADALYAIRTGARFMDTQRMRQALQVYSLNNGTLEGLYGAVASLDPFNGMDRRAVREFVGKMNTGDRQRVKEAMAWYASAFAPHGRAPLAEKVSLKLGTEFTDADNDAGMIPLDSYIRSTGRMVEREWAKAVRRTLREMPEEKRELRRNERGR